MARSNGVLVPALWGSALQALARGVHAFVRHPREALPLGAGVCALLSVAVWAALRHRPGTDVLEARRRAHLLRHGRLTDGELTGCLPALHAPSLLVYRYRVAGVTYECSQDVAPFTASLQLPALQLPVQVRYNRANPADSMVMAEGWNGLWSAAAPGVDALPRMSKR